MHASSFPGSESWAKLSPAMPAVPRYSRRYAAPRLGPVERWFLPALLLTAALHFGGYHLLHATHFNGFTVPRDPRPPSRVFQVQRATIDPKTLDNPKEPEKPPTKPVPDVTEIQIPGETKPSYEQLMQQPERDIIVAPEASTTMAMEKPRVDQAKPLEKVVSENNNPAALPSDLKALTDQLLNGKPNVTSNHPSFEVTGNANGSRPNAGPNPGVANFSNLDSLISSKGPLTSKTAPILLPTDLLFDYNAADLRSEAVGSLQKLAELMQRNPNATFIIEGHTDNFGTPEYNLDLSKARAESVKNWLVDNEGIDPARIQTRGLGLTRLLVTGGNIEQQKLNRRVEIVIKSNKGTTR